MKILVDSLPKTCNECDYCAEAIMMSPLGVQKPVNVCTLVAALVPQRPDVEPKTINKDNTPIQNDCPCKERDVVSSIII